MKINVQCSLLLIDLAFIYNSLNTLSGGKSRLVAPEVPVPPWATETVITPDWRLMRTWYRTSFHMYDENLKKYIIL